MDIMEFGSFFGDSTANMADFRNTGLPNGKPSVNHLSSVPRRDNTNRSYNGNWVGNTIYKTIVKFNKKMAEAKIGWLILAHLFGTTVYGYALYIEWGTVKGIILSVLGIIYAMVQIARFVIKGLKELYEFKKQLKDFNKPTEQPPVHKHAKHG